MTAVNPLFTTIDKKKGGGRQADAGAEKAIVAPDPTCRKVLDRFSMMFQGHEYRSSSDWILDHPRMLRDIDSAITSQ